MDLTIDHYRRKSPDALYIFYEQCIRDIKLDMCKGGDRGGIGEVLRIRNLQRQELPRYMSVAVAELVQL